MKLFLPEVDPSDDITAVCLICGATANQDHEMVAPNGMITMTVDRDLCLECAVHVWRAAKELHGDGAVKFHAFEMLKRYSLTAPAMKRQCAKLHLEGGQ